VRVSYRNKVNCLMVMSDSLDKTAPFLALFRSLPHCSDILLLVAFTGSVAFLYTVWLVEY
jgi:hypothetical protein